MNQPRILYIWQAKYPWDVRVEKVCQALINQGCQVMMLARWKPGQAPTEDCGGIQVVRVGSSRFNGKALGWSSAPVPFNPLWTRQIRKSLDDWKPDLVIAREIMLAETASRICRRRGVPVIIDMAEHYPATMR